MFISEIIGDYLDAKVYIIEKNNHCLIIDSGAPVSKVKNQVKNKIVDAVLLTHGHYDHSKYCNDYAKEFQCKIYANRNITETFSNTVALYADNDFVSFNMNDFVFIDEDDLLKINDFDIQCFYCPGHCVCCECYLIDGHLFAGDVLFDGGIGRTDLVLSDKNQMYKSLCKLDKIDFVDVYSGHGDNSSFNEQKRNIAVFKRFLSRE